jgi:hypothetical protein
MRRSRLERKGLPLPDLILAILKRESQRSTYEIATELDYGTEAIRLHLFKLMAAGYVHFIPVRVQGRRGLKNLWQYGPTPLDYEPGVRFIEEKPAKEEKLSLKPNQRSHTSYPSVGRRDPLVEALFGQANTSSLGIETQSLADA